MEFCFPTVAALFLLFTAASCAPARPGLQDACEGVRHSSLELNHVARAVALHARNGSKDVIDFSTSLVWMEATDMCDPETLKQESAPCVGKVLDVLSSYNSAVGRLAGFQSCSQFVSKVKQAIHNLHKDIRTCVKLRGDHKKESHISNEHSQPIPRWQQALLCHYTMDRLFSFSILTARVFAVGDPAHHTQGSAQRCI